MIAFLCLPALAARCDQAPPLTPAVASGEWTEELLTPGTTYYVEPSNCLRGQVLVATVTCDEGDTRGPGGICFLGGACLTCCTAQATLSDPPALCAPARVPHTPTPLILCFFMCSARPALVHLAFRHPKSLHHFFGNDVFVFVSHCKYDCIVQASSPPRMRCPTIAQVIPHHPPM